MQCLVVTGCADITGDLVGCLEIAMRKDVNKPKLPAVKHLCMRDMVNLRRAICKQTAIDKVSYIILDFFSLVMQGAYCLFTLKVYFMT